MSKNLESPAQTVNGQSVQTDKEVIENCFISRQTWGFLSCVLALHDLYDRVEDAIIKMYGNEQLDEEIKPFILKYNELESVLYQYVNTSINDNISVINFSKI